MSGSTWAPPGPISAAFYETDDELALLMGPVGSGKTTVGLQRGTVRALYQKPNAEGVRESCFAVVRRQYTDLHQTTIKSWNRWYPRTVGTWYGGNEGPCSHTIMFRHPADRGLVKLDVQFRALGDLSIEEALRGFEPTFGYVDELDLTPADTMTFLLQRAGRFPAREYLGWSGVWATCNAPEVPSWVVDDFIEEPKPGHRFFRQPGGLSPSAENLENLPPGYYERIVNTSPKHKVRRFVHNQPGISRDGDPVYEEFNDEIHMSATPLQVLPGIDIVVGLDAGGSPAAGVWQRAPHGQKRKLRELTTHNRADGESITGPNRFGGQLAELLQELMRDFPAGKPRPRIRGVADPSAAYGADTDNGESSWIDTVARVAGIPVYPAQTNDVTPRQEAYRLPMLRMIDGRIPGLLIDPSCRLTRRALAREYMFTRVRGVYARRSATPLKNWASHLVDADQYALLDGTAFHEVMGRQAAQSSARQTHQAKTDFNPLA